MGQTTIFKFPEIEAGTLRHETEWSNSQQKQIEIDERQYFIDRIKRLRHQLNYKDFHLYDSIPAIDFLDASANTFHKNYMHYLEKCWGQHLGIIITPDIIWYTILCEVAAIVKTSPETYRQFFTTSNDKKLLLTPYEEKFPLDKIVTLLKDEVPTDISKFFPNFEFTKDSKFAFHAAFCDICSPYYDYSMLLCGFPAIQIKGNVEDWKLLKEHWDNLKSIMVENETWILNVNSILNNILANFKNPDFWKNIFSVKKCGSGHQTVVSGWFADLFAVSPRVKYAQNYSTHISNIKYSIIDVNRHFEMNVGLFSSMQIDEFLEPSFSSIVYETTEFLKLTKNLQLVK